MNQRILIIILFILGCSKDSIPDPSPVILIEPFNNNNCETAIPININESTVNFFWSKSDNTDKYELVVTNGDKTKTNNVELDDPKTENEIKNISYGMLLLTAESYSWYVLSKSVDSPVVTKSETWQFYLEGNVEADYIPQPTNLIYPKNNSTLSLETSDLVEFLWSSKDKDNDIQHYHFYLGVELENMEKIGENIKSTSYEQKLDFDQTYFWKIIAFDSRGNSSDSGINKFYTVP